MKNRLFTLFAVSAALAVTASAQQVGRPLVVDIPFAFTAGKTLLDAGVYKIQAERPHIISLRKEDGGSGVMMITTPTSLKRSDWAPKVIFNRYGNEYFLSRVCNLQQSLGMAVPPSKQEKELRARLGAPGERVIVAQR